MSDEGELLPKEFWEYYIGSQDHLIVTHMRVRNGVLEPVELRLTDLPNDLVTASDLKALGIEFEDGRPVYCLKLGRDAAPDRHAVGPDLI